MNSQINKAILLLSCPDTLGVVARISHFIFERRGNIINLEQHVDTQDKMFFMRIEWDLKDFTIPFEDLNEAFSPLGKEFKANWTIQLINSFSKPKVALFISNHPDLEPIAKNYNIDFRLFPINKENKIQQEQKEIALLKEYKIDLIVLARYMQVLTDNFIAEFPHQIINIHHSFLPAFIGSNPYKQAQERGVKIIGATSHYATADLDEGPIIQQDITRISHSDSLNDLICKGRDLERTVLAKAVKLHLESKILVHNHKTIIFET